LTARIRVQDRRLQSQCHTGWFANNKRNINSELGYCGPSCVLTEGCGPCYEPPRTQPQLRQGFHTYGPRTRRHCILERGVGVLHRRKVASCAALHAAPSPEWISSCCLFCCIPWTTYLAVHVPRNMHVIHGHPTSTPKQRKAECVQWRWVRAAGHE